MPNRRWHVLFDPLNQANMNLFFASSMHVTPNGRVVGQAFKIGLKRRDPTPNGQSTVFTRQDFNGGIRSVQFNHGITT